jgi:hypothetical protein
MAIGRFFRRFNRPDKPAPIDVNLEHVNSERKRKGLRPLSRLEATSALRARVIADPVAPRDTSLDFLIGLETGIPMPSAEGIIGAAMHSSFEPSHQSTSPDTTPSYQAPDCSPPSVDTSPSYSAPDCSSPSTDSGGGSFDGGSSGTF